MYSINFPLERICKHCNQLKRVHRAITMQCPVSNTNNKVIWSDTTIYCPKDYHEGKEIKENRNEMSVL